MYLKRSVLLLEEDAERFQQVSRLLRVAGYAYRQVKNPAEALNWVMTGGATAEDCLCLLVNDTKPLPALAELLGRVENRGALLPLVLVQRGGPAGEQLPPPTALTEKLLCISCTATNLASTLAGLSAPGGSLNRKDLSYAV